MVIDRSIHIAVIGGGLAGLTAAAFLAEYGFRVTVFEKGTYPSHKVCGEYISREILPVLSALGFDPLAEGAVDIRNFRLTDVRGHEVTSELPLGAFGLSRYYLDHRLYQLALGKGAIVHMQAQVNGVERSGEKFRITMQDRETTEADIVIGAFGKWSNMDRVMSRTFFVRKSPYIGVKYHFRYSVRQDEVALHNFPGGYCGVSAVENQVTNVCYLALAGDLKKTRSIAMLEQQQLFRNPHLAWLFTEGEKLFEEPKVISNVSFYPKQPVEQGIFMAGDAAGLITPLCGNGMAMAIRSGFMLSELMILASEEQRDRQWLESAYSNQWNNTFRSRLYTGLRLQSLFGKKTISAVALGAVKVFPFLLPLIIKNTHGKPVHSGI